MAAVTWGVPGPIHGAAQSCLPHVLLGSKTQAKAGSEEVGGSGREVPLGLASALRFLTSDPSAGLIYLESSSL